MAFSSTKQSTAELTAFVKRYAAEHYEKDGWDLVVETMIAADIAEVIKTATTERGAIYAMVRHIRPAHIRREEIKAEAF